MAQYPFKLIYGNSFGLEEKATELISQALSEYLDYPLPVQSAREDHSEALQGWNLILAGTLMSNPLLRQLAEKGAFQQPMQPEGYSLKVMQSPFDPDAQLILVAGYDERGVLYGAADFAAFYIPWAESTNDHMHYFRKIFRDEALPEYSRVSAPAIRHRGIWTWGHVIYDYIGYIKNMARLKMNTLIVWNDYVPLNIRDVIRYAHTYGVRIYLGFSWGWNEARQENGGLNIADEAALSKITQGIIEKYEMDFSGLDMDGIYFQSFTETHSDQSNGIVIAERVTRLVNQTAEVLFAKKPDLTLMFGLHATSVSDKLDFIRRTDKRIVIVWEDCGAFPYAYTPNRIEDFERTCAFSEKIATLRGTDDAFGIVSKGQVCLDWTTFRHMKGSFVMGCQSEEFIRRRTEEKEALWKIVDAWWMGHAGYAYDMVKLLRRCNENTLITSLVEDGMLEARIHLATALFAEMLWDVQSNPEVLLLKTAMRKDVFC